ALRDAVRPSASSLLSSGKKLSFICWGGVDSVWLVRNLSRYAPVAARFNDCYSLRERSEFPLSTRSIPPERRALSPSLNTAVAPIRYTSFHSLLGRRDDSVWLVLRLSRDTLPSRGLNASATTAPTTRDSSSELQRRVKKTWEGSVGAVTRGLVGSRRWMRDGR
ncbi:hypothetical protein PMAYCL1PPCAC_27717, partial [Pristionchus mayeri]